MGDRLAALAVAVPFLLGSFAAVPPGDSGAEAVFRFQDPAIVESSGLVATDRLFLTTNDSGDSGRVFAVDPSGGDTVGVTHWADEPTDVEALAPAGPGQVWVADIGDNSAARRTVSVARVPVGRGERNVQPVAFELAYPDSAHDAEALLAHPVTGRLYIATKNVFGGRLYAAPRDLDPDRVNPLESLGRVMPIVTDGAFLPDGSHLVLRDYGRAVLYTFPALEAVGEVDLPDQEQGEGIAVAADGSAYVSSEGRLAPVLRVPLPDPPMSGTASEDGPAEEPSSGSGPPWLLTGVLGLGVVALAALAALVLRRR